MGDLSGRRELAELKPLINPPPHDLGAEQALLSGCMLSTDAVHAVLEMGVSKVTFYQQRHQGLFAGVLDCLERDVAIDLITFEDALTRLGTFEECGGILYLGEVYAQASSGANVRHHAGILLDLHQRRRLIEIAADTDRRARDLSTGSGETARNLEAQAKVLDAGNEDEPGVRTLRLTCAAEIRVQRVTWLWENRIPTGEITLTPGLGGIGKSTFHAWLISQVTRGKLPGVHLGNPKAAIICASEDSWERTIVPRLIGAEADLDRVYRVDVVEAEENVNLKLPADIEDLAALIASHDVAVVSLDPVMSLISGTIDTHKDADVRRALEPLTRLADDTGCSILGNAHFNKSMGTDPMIRLTGSAAFGQVVRAVLAFARDPESDTCVISQAKNNLGRQDLPSLSYSIESVEVDTEDGLTSVGRLLMGGESERSVKDILGDQGHSEDRSARGEAERFLRELLKDGPVSAKEGKAQAEDAGIAEKTLRNARERICEVYKDGMSRGWFWSLKPEDAPPSPKMPLPQDRASSASSGAPSIRATEPSDIPAIDLVSRDTPPDTCPACHQAQWWTDTLSRRRVCGVCHPAPISVPIEA